MQPDQPAAPLDRREITRRLALWGGDAAPLDAMLDGHTRRSAGAGTASPASTGPLGGGAHHGSGNQPCKSTG